MNKEKQQAQELALEAESYVRQLNGLTNIIEQGEIISVLKSTCLLLRRLVERAEFLQTSADLELQTARLNQPQPLPSEAPALQLSATIQELIKLRDWVLLAKKNQPNGDNTVLSAIYQQLGQILAQEGVVGIEDAGLFNYERQQIIATQVTDDPEQDEYICDTVRSGYLFQGQLIRPQEVIVYCKQEK
jgi:molecular chaperone GrpE (heat shock protein)